MSLRSGRRPETIKLATIVGRKGVTGVSEVWKRPGAAGRRWKNDGSDLMIRCWCEKTTGFIPVKDVGVTTFSCGLPACTDPR